MIFTTTAFAMAQFAQTLKIHHLHHLPSPHHPVMDPIGKMVNTNGIPSGKRWKITMENQHFVAGKTHYFYGHFQ